MPNINYDRENRDRQYISIQKHHRNARNEYSKWFSLELEKDTFDAADYGNHEHREGDESWADDRGNLWGFLENFPDVGTEGEQFGFFQQVRNPTDRWHGFPIIPFQKKRISDELLAFWLENNYIDEHYIQTLLKRKKL